MEIKEFHALDTMQKGLIFLLGLFLIQTLVLDQMTIKKTSFAFSQLP